MMMSAEELHASLGAEAAPDIKGDELKLAWVGANRRSEELQLPQGLDVPELFLDPDMDKLLETAEGRVVLIPTLREFLEQRQQEGFEIDLNLRFDTPEPPKPPRKHRAKVVREKQKKAAAAKKPKVGDESPKHGGEEAPPTKWRKKLANEQALAPAAAKRRKAGDRDENPSSKPEEKKPRGRPPKKKIAGDGDDSEKTPMKRARTPRKKPGDKKPGDADDAERTPGKGARSPRKKAADGDQKLGDDLKPLRPRGRRKKADPGTGEEEQQQMPSKRRREAPAAAEQSSRKLSGSVITGAVNLPPQSPVSVFPESSASASGPANPPPVNSPRNALKRAARLRGQQMPESVLQSPVKEFLQQLSGRDFLNPVGVPLERPPARRSQQMAARVSQTTVNTAQQMPARAPQNVYVSQQQMLARVSQRAPQSVYQQMPASSPQNLVNAPRQMPVLDSEQTVSQRSQTPNVPQQSSVTQQMPARAFQQMPAVVPQEQNVAYQQMPAGAFQQMLATASQQNSVFQQMPNLPQLNPVCYPQNFPALSQQMPVSASPQMPATFSTQQMPATFSSRQMPDLSCQQYPENFHQNLGLHVPRSVPLTEELLQTPVNVPVLSCDPWQSAIAQQMPRDVSQAFSPVSALIPWQPEASWSPGGPAISGRTKRGRNVLEFGDMPASGVNENEIRSIVPYVGAGALVPSKKKKPKPRAKIPLDEETQRVYLLLMNYEEEDAQTTFNWQEERDLMEQRVKYFIDRMHLIQGNRRFSRWKGSVVDSVIGAFLTQNVSDHLSSSAFMNMAARFPPFAFPKDFDPVPPTPAPAPARNPTPNPSSAAPGSEKAAAYRVEEVEDDPMIIDDEDTDRRSSVRRALFVDEAQKTRAGDEEEQTEKPVDEQKPVEAEVEAAADGNEDQWQETERPVAHELLADAAKMEVGDEEKSVEVEVGADDERQETERRVAHGDENPVEAMEVGEGTMQHTTTTEKVQQETERPVDDQKRNEETIQRPVDVADQTTTGTEKVQKPLMEAQSPAEPHTEDGEGVVRQAEVPVDFRKYLEEEDIAPEDVILQPEGAEGGAAGMPSDEKIAMMSGRKEFTEHVFTMYRKAMEMEASGKKKLTGISGIARARMEHEKSSSKSSYDWEKIKDKARAAGNVAPPQDAVDWHAVLDADVSTIAETIRERGMNNVLAGRIKAVLERIYEEHGSIDLEWIRHVPPKDAKDFLLTIRGLGIKSVECIRLLTLEHVAFPVDVNVGRIFVRLGWVPIEPLPEELQLHLLELYPVQETIQKYIWPRLCKLPQPMLYEFHYQMITFGKVFCTKSKPNCNACPLRSKCKHYESAFASARLALPAPSDDSSQGSTLELPAPGSNPSKACEPIIEEPPDEEPEKGTEMESGCCGRSSNSCSACSFGSSCSSSSSPQEEPPDMEDLVFGANKRPKMSPASSPRSKEPSTSSSQHSPIAASSSSSPATASGDDQVAAAAASGDDQGADDQAAAAAAATSGDDQGTDDQAAAGAAAASGDDQAAVAAAAASGDDQGAIAAGAASGDDQGTVTAAAASGDDQGAAASAASGDDQAATAAEGEEYTCFHLDITTEVDFSKVASKVDKEAEEDGFGSACRVLMLLPKEGPLLPQPKLKDVYRLRTVHYVYELPDNHPLVHKMKLKREPDDPSFYLFVLWQPLEEHEQEKVNFSDEYVKGSLLIPCRSGMRGAFPLNGTYFQVNEVFADHRTSHFPVEVRRSWLWKCTRRFVNFGSSVTAIFKGLTTEEVQAFFWRGYICVRGFDRGERRPKPLAPWLHSPAANRKRLQRKKQSREEGDD